MKVPILNLYYMLCYAWNMLDEGRVMDASAEPFQSLPDLFARVLRTGVTHLLRRGLDRGYIPEEEDTRSPRGKFDISATLKRNLRLRSRVHCRFDDFRPDVLHNQILKATLVRLARCENLARPLQGDVASLCRRLHDVTPADLTNDVFEQVVIHRNNRIYSFLVEVCRILFMSLLVDPASGHTTFRDFLGDKRAMARLFEQFVLNFYHREQTTFDCDRKKVLWSDVECDREASAFLPEMHTDVTLSSPGRTIVIDTKYYVECLQSYRDLETLHSGHLYQLFAYLKNMASGHPHPDCLEGILLYPVVTRSLDLRYRLHGHPIRVVTIDLNQPWQSIRDRLLDLIA